MQELTGSTVNANLLTGGIDEVFQRKEATATRYPITDALGSVIALTDGTGALATEYSFEPYGKATRTGSADNNSQSFTAREDDGTGLFYYRARYYMPGCGRFASEDPLGIEAGPNPYAYVSGAPTLFTDPTGLTECDVEAAMSYAVSNYPDFQYPPFGWSTSIPNDSNQVGRNLFGLHIQYAERYGKPLTDIGLGVMYNTVLHELSHSPRTGYRFEFMLNEDDVNRRMGESLNGFKKFRRQVCGG